MNRRQRGSTALEFAFVLIAFLMFMLGVMDFARMLFTWSAASEAARTGVRYAAVCDDTGNQALVLARMQRLLPQVQNISLDWQPSGCSSGSCETVTLTIENLQYRWISPVIGLAPRWLTMPRFSSTLTREVMRQDPNSASICS